MTLNFSHPPVFPAHLAEDNTVSQMRLVNNYLVEGLPEKVEDLFDYGRDRSHGCGSQELMQKDILDLLPSDPFGMDISTIFNAITSQLEDLEVDYGGYGMDQVATGDRNHSLFSGFNYIWSNAIFQGFSGNMGFDHKLNVVGGFEDGYLVEREAGDVSGYGGLGSACDMEDNFSFGNEVVSDKNADVMDESCEYFQDSCSICSEGDGEIPHEAFGLVLSYLDVRDLLVVEMVCRSLRTTVQSDAFLWRSIHIDQPMNEKITDDVLLQLTSRAQGQLQCLSLVECPRITDDGLKRVLKYNPKLSKLSVPGCTRLNIDGILTSLREFKLVGPRGVKHLRIGGLYGVTLKHFEELKLLLGVETLDSHMQQNTNKPHFYHRGNFYLSCEDDRAIDIEMCPQCQNLRLVYDCPAEDCQGKQHPNQVCRACTLCIARCVQCGRCVNNSEYEETFCLELLCSDCWQQLQKCQEKQDRTIGLSGLPALHGSSVIHHHG